MNREPTNRDKAIMSAKSKEQELSENFLKGSISLDERYTQTIKVWSGVLTRTITVFILFAVGVVGITAFLTIMLLPLLK